MTSPLRGMMEIGVAEPDGREIDPGWFLLSIPAGATAAKYVGKVHVQLVVVGVPGAVAAVEALTQYATKETWYLHLEAKTSGGGPAGDKPRGVYIPPGRTTPDVQLRFEYIGELGRPDGDIRMAVIEASCSAPRTMLPGQAVARAQPDPGGARPG